MLLVYGLINGGEWPLPFVGVASIEEWMLERRSWEGNSDFSTAPTFVNGVSMVKQREEEF